MSVWASLVKMSVRITLVEYNEFISLIDQKIANLQEYVDAVEALQEIKGLAERFSCAESDQETESLRSASSQPSIVDLPESEPTVNTRRRRVKRKLPKVFTFIHY